jgi:feruloyl-CoA synthase
MWQQVQATGQALIDLGAESGDRLAILSGNSIEHAIVMFAAMAIGVVVAPISLSYSLLPGGMARIEDIAKVLRPQFVFTERRDPFFAARRIPELSGATWIANEAIDGAVELATLLSTEPGPAFRQRLLAIDLDAPAKILFTSGRPDCPRV